MKIEDLSQWKAFYWVAHEQSFTKAAVKMGVGVAYISKKIAMLEDSLQVRLFQRSTRRVAVTEDGRAILPHIHTVLEDLDGIESQILNQGVPAGAIRMTTLPVIAARIVAPLLERFSKRYPDIQFHIETSEHIVDLIDSQMDLAIRVENAPKDSSLVYRKLFENQLIFCASEKYLSKHGIPKTPKDLQKHSLLFLEAHEDLQFITNGRKLGEFNELRKYRSESGLFLSELALNDCGIALRSIWDVDRFLKSGKLVQVLKHHPIETFGSVYAVIPSSRFLASRVRVWINFMLESLAIKKKDVIY